jgi:hypothetical protein
MTDEIQGAVASLHQVEFSENVAQLFGSNPVVPGSSENIFFVAPYPNSAAGDLCVIAYQHNAGNYELQRAFLKSDDAWKPTSNRYRPTGYASSSPPPTWRTVAQGVVEFEIKSYSQQDLDTNATPAPTWSSENTTSSAMIGNVPRRVVLRLVAIDDKALARLRAVPASSTAYRQILAQSAREFTADIALLPPH